MTGGRATSISIYHQESFYKEATLSTDHWVTEATHYSCSPSEAQTAPPPPSGKCLNLAPESADKTLAICERFLAI